ncbi:hypothetical protein PHLCEN_2v12602 [Hermanssonia centrifuga]|uniref:Uncharacterized protein n=1 Tax=Hermanssonia centrifuga TaxID=98765 RepID=A0A2R6NGR5_9APHY|nr:hypothetical protein PHLCEN_2v12602 [Hermanssonia centrifuga]
MANSDPDGMWASSPASRSSMIFGSSGNLMHSTPLTPLPPLGPPHMLAPSAFEGASSPDGAADMYKNPYQRYKRGENERGVWRIQINSIE